MIPSHVSAVDCTLHKRLQGIGGGLTIEQRSLSSSQTTA